MNTPTQLMNCAQVLIGKNVDKAKTNEKAQGYPLIVGASDIHQPSDEMLALTQQFKNIFQRIKNL